MEYLPNSFNANSRNLVSRNRPVALIANACTFLGSSLTGQLLEKGIQVIAIDDLTIFDKRKIEQHSKNRDFHLFNFGLDSDEILEKFKKFELPRLDYGFFITDTLVPDIIIGKGIVNFVELIGQIKESEAEGKKNQLGDRPRLAFVSTINLYGKNYDQHERIIKEAETKFAKGIKHFKLNGRVVRLAEVYGPRMDFDGDTPLSLLIQAALVNRLDDVPTSLDFSVRSLFIDDAVSLLTKSVLSGATSNKIFDGALLHPVKLSEIKRALNDLTWFEENKGQITKLSEWPTPNLTRTIKELFWTPKTPIIKALKETINYFKDHQNEVPEIQEKKAMFKNDKTWSFEGTGFLGNDSNEPKESEGRKHLTHPVQAKGLDSSDYSKKDFDKEFKEHKRKTPSGKAKHFLGMMIVLGLLFFGLVWPFFFLSYQAFNIRHNLIESRDNLETGEFSKAEEHIRKAADSAQSFKDFLQATKLIEKIPKIGEYHNKALTLADITREGLDGVYFAITGSKSLFETTKVISGESREDPLPYYQVAKTDLDFAADKLAKVSALLSDPSLKQGLPIQAGEQIDELKLRLAFYLSLVEKTKLVSELMPKITGLEGKKSYLLLLQNNLELRPGGGFIGSYAKLDFESGKLTHIKVDDIYSLDGGLKEVIVPPAELKSDLGIDRLYLRDSNFEPDFPTSARQASFFYKKEAGESVHGVIALDLKASGNLLDAVGGLDLPEYGESVSGANLFERAISHAETGFFPGSQAKKNYLTSLQTQMFNRIFYLSKQNWPAIIQAISKSLEQKHMLVYLEDPALFSHLASSNWSGVFPRESAQKEGETNDFLAIVESNMGANKANYFLQRKITLQSSFTKEGKISHNLKINYKNTSPSEIFPAGVYKNRFKIYTPAGTTLNKATLGESDITQSFRPFSDYGRSGFSALILIAPKEQKQLTLDYTLAKPLNFKDNNVVYKLEVFKQPGVMADPLDFILNYPINFKIKEKPEGGNAGVQEVKIQTDMQTDRVFQFKITK